jgi:hypothetical protein
MRTEVCQCQANPCLGLTLLAVVEHGFSSVVDTSFKLQVGRNEKECGQGPVAENEDVEENGGS